LEGGSVVRDKRYAKVLPNNEKLRNIIDKYGQYFEVVGSPELIPQLNNQLGVTLKDEDITFTTEVRNIRIVQP
jgi:hypothetical protein